MSLEIAVVRFDGEGTAVKRYAGAKERLGDAPWTQKVGFVECHHNGRLLLRGLFAGHYLDVDESDHVSQKGAAEGAAAGGIAGLLLGPAGLAAGLALGGLIGSQVAHGSEIEAEPEAFAQQLRELIPRSSSAVVMIAGRPEVDEMVEALAEGAQSTVRRTLSDEEATALEASLGPPPASTPGA
jgi:uncharacterized membrane protein